VFKVFFKSIFNVLENAFDGLKNAVTNNVRNAFSAFKKYQKYQKTLF